MSKEELRASPSSGVSRSATASGAVFLSYASEDATTAERIATALQSAGIEIWFDKTELRGGDVWDQKIRRQIRECALFMPIISAHSQQRLEGYFRLEWKLAVDRSHLMAAERPFLVPVVIDDTHDAAALVPDRFREVQWTRLAAGETSPDFHARVRRMLEVTSGTSGVAASPEAGIWSDSLPEKSLAVMPFANLSADRENEYFSDGLSEEVLNALSGVAELRVAARSSSFYFKGRTTDLQEIARRLRVAHIVEGSVRRAGNRVRVMAQLVDLRNGFQLWSERYDRELADVFEIQDEIARAISARLKVALLSGARRPTSNMEAYELYLQGHHHLNQRSPTSIHAAVQYFERCIALDPNYALAHAGLVHCYGILFFRGLTSHAAAKARAQTAMQKAIECAPELWECNFSRAVYLNYFESDWNEADPYFKRALEINPRASLANAYYAVVNSIVQREAEALRYVEDACKLDPLSANIHALSSAALVILGKFSEGEALAHHALELQPDHMLGLWWHASALSGLRRHDEAVATMERVVSIARTPVFTGSLGLVYGRAGRHEDAGRLRQELEDRRVRGEFSIGIGRLALELGSNDNERVREALTAAAGEAAQGYLIRLACGPFMEPYRSDPEIDRLCRKLYGW